MIGRQGRLAGLLAALVALGSGLGGCAGGSQEKYKLAVEENQELRQRVVALQAAKETSDSEAERLRMENSQLAQALDEAQRELDKGGSGGPVNIGGLPAGVSVGTRGSDVVVTVAGDVLFDSGSANLKSQAKSDLARIASIINQRYPGHSVRVEGYTDTDPIRKSGWKSNEHLSAERALAVERALVEQGFSNDRVYSAAFGPSRPRGSKKESRRVEIVVLAPGS